MNFSMQIQKENCKMDENFEIVMEMKYISHVLNMLFSKNKNGLHNSRNKMSLILIFENIFQKIDKKNNI